VEIGRVTGDGMLRATMNGTLVADVPVTALADEAPVYEKPTRAACLAGWPEAFDPLLMPAPADPGETLLAPLLALARHRLNEWVYRQYDMQVGINTLVMPGSMRESPYQGHSGRRWL
jgi:phosphoribosylformylglycinamidine synthase